MYSVGSVVQFTSFIVGRLRSLFVVSVGLPWFYATIGSLVVLVRQVCVGECRSVATLSVVRSRSVGPSAVGVLQSCKGEVHQVVMLCVRCSARWVLSVTWSFVYGHRVVCLTSSISHGLVFAVIGRVYAM